MGKIKIAQIGLGHDHALWTLQSIIDNWDAIRKIIEKIYKLG